MRRQKKNSGLTLIELLLVTALITIIVAIVFPKIDRRNYHLMTSGRLLRDEIRSIRYIKMTEGKNYRLLLAGNKYYIFENGIPIKEVKLEEDFNIAHNINGGNIIFSHIGAPQSSGTIKIIDNETNKYCEITIVPATGRVLLKNQIFEGYNENKSNNKN